MLHNNTQIHRWLTITSIALLFFLSACGGHKNLTYFTDIQKDSVTLGEMNPSVVLIRNGDLLSVRVSSTDEITIARINGASASPGATGATSSAGAGYLVNDSGYVNLPLVGNLKATGLTKEALSDTIKHRLINEKIVLDAIVIVRISNYKITVLGEVNRPGVIAVPDERITLPEAIATAGDLTIYGNRVNVLIIRNKGGKRIYKRIDLTKNDFFNSGYYFLENQDIVYIEPIKKKAKVLDNSTQIYSLVLSTMSILALLYTQIVR